MKQKKGFTIVELVIVIAVIAILAAVLIPTFSNLINRANVSADQQAVRQMNEQLIIAEHTEGKPLDIAGARKIIKAGGYDVAVWHPLTAGYEAYWIRSVNRIVLYDTAKEEVVYPQEYCSYEKDGEWFALLYVSSEGLEFTLNSTGDGLILSGIGTCRDLDVIIPETAEQNGKLLPVTEIDGQIFYKYPTVKSVSIPASVMKIAQKAFRYLENSLETVTFAKDSAITELPINLFGTSLKFTALRTVTLPASLTALPSGIFSGAEALSEVTFGENSRLKTIGDSAFYNCSSLLSIVLPDGLEKIGTETTSSGAFQNSGLKKISIPASVTMIGNAAFMNCKNLEEIAWADGCKLETIGVNAFVGCVSLKSLALPSTLQSIKESAFSGCSKLGGELVIPRSVQEIGDSAFTSVLFDKVIFEATKAEVTEKGINVNTAFKSAAGKEMVIVYNGGAES